MRTIKQATLFSLSFATVTIVASLVVTPTFAAQALVCPTSTYARGSLQMVPCYVSGSIPPGRFGSPSSTPATQPTIPPVLPTLLLDLPLADDGSTAPDTGVSMAPEEDSMTPDNGASMAPEGGMGNDSMGNADSGGTTDTGPQSPNEQEDCPPGQEGTNGN